MLRAYIDDKSDGNITRALLLLSRLFASAGEVSCLKFFHKIKEGNHEPFSRSDVCWGDNRRGGINVGVGIALPGPQLLTEHRARPSASYWKEPSQFRCAGAYTAAVGLVAKSHGAGRTKIFFKSRRQRMPLAGGHSTQPPTGRWLCCCWFGSWLPPWAI